MRWSCECCTDVKIHLQFTRACLSGVKTSMSSHQVTRPRVLHRAFGTMPSLRFHQWPQNNRERADSKHIDDFLVYCASNAPLIELFVRNMPCLLSARNFGPSGYKSPLANTITAQVALKKGEVARKQCKDAEEQLLQCTFLPEERVDFAGDEHGLHLNWLGNAPFMQAQHSIMNNDLANKIVDKTAKALSLHVKLSDKTFNSGLNGNKVHIKIEILFNGKLAGSSFIPIHDVRSGVKPLHQVFAGTRIDFLSERPWVLLPSRATAHEIEQRISVPFDSSAMESYLSRTSN